MVSEYSVEFPQEPKYTRLNPCCYGRWSQRMVMMTSTEQMVQVLILVVMEDGLRDGTAE